MASTPLPVLGSPAPRQLPDYLPARMVNEFVYCPRLFFYEWIDGVFKESADTIEGSAQHKRVDKPGKALPAPQISPASRYTPDPLRSRAKSTVSSLSSTCSKSIPAS
jgi:hypothetical protein